MLNLPAVALRQDQHTAGNVDQVMLISCRIGTNRFFRAMLKPEAGLLAENNSSRHLIGH